MLGEFTCYAYFFYLLIKLHWLKKMAVIFICTFPLFWFIAVFSLFGLKNWNSYVYIVGSLFIMLFVIGYYYQLITNEEVKRLTNNSEFWIATGLIIFFAGNLPYLGMYNFLIKNYSDLADSLSTILRLLNIMMYSLFAYAYICRRFPA